MSGGMFLKQSQVVQQSPSYICSLHGSLRAIVILTLLSFIFFSLKSFRFPLQCSSPVPPHVEENRVVVEGGDKGEFSDIYHSPEVFRLNYVEMEKKFKVYINPDGVPNTFYQTPRKLTGKYASEGYFCRTLGRVILLPMIQIRRTSSLFQFLVTRCEAREHLMKMTMIVQKYVESLITKYPYWNRTLGTDHFFVTCRDVGVRVTEGLPFLVKNSIRAVCSPSYDVGFIPHKDVALPQVLQPFALPAGGNDVENRTTLGFWAGHLNSKIRVILA